MKKLLLIMAITLGFTTPISAKMLWECSILEAGETVGRITRFEDTLVLMAFNGETYQHSCIKADFNSSKNCNLGLVNSFFIIARAQTKAAVRTRCFGHVVGRAVVC